MDRVNPILVETTRGTLVECRHRGAAVVVDAMGRVVHSWGDVDRPIYARSAAKPLQALPLLETGAADAFGLGEAEIALSAASHSGETRHTERVAAWLGRMGLGPRDLECGAHAPMNEAASSALIRAGAAFSALHNNCSGKHTGFLATAVHRAEPTTGYIRPDHPVQRRVTAALAEMGEFDAARAPTGTDGCGIPTIGLSLTALARGMARMATPTGLSRERAEACRRIVAAMMHHPALVAGSARFDTAVMAALPGIVAVKAGAEGVHIAILPQAGLGMALKIDDGGGRASEVALANLLDRLDVLDAAQRGALAPWCEVPMRNWVGRQTGVVRAADGWLGRAS